MTDAAGADRASTGLLGRLSLMMFLQYAIWGAWLPFLYSFLDGYRKMPGDQRTIRTCGRRLSGA